MPNPNEITRIDLDTVERELQTIAGNIREWRNQYNEAKEVIRQVNLHVNNAADRISELLILLGSQR